VILPPEYDGESRAAVEEVVMRYLPFIPFEVDEQMMKQICALQVLECDLVEDCYGVSYADWLATRDGNGLE